MDNTFTFGFFGTVGCMHPHLMSDDVYAEYNKLSFTTEEENKMSMDINMYKIFEDAALNNKTFSLEVVKYDGCGNGAIGTVWSKDILTLYANTYADDPDGNTLQYVIDDIIDDAVFWARTERSLDYGVDDYPYDYVLSVRSVSENGNDYTEAVIGVIDEDENLQFGETVDGCKYQLLSEIEIAA